MKVRLGKIPKGIKKKKKTQICQTTLETDGAVHYYPKLTAVASRCGRKEGRGKKTLERNSGFPFRACMPGWSHHPEIYGSSASLRALHVGHTSEADTAVDRNTRGEEDRMNDNGREIERSSERERESCVRRRVEANIYLYINYIYESKNNVCDNTAALNSK